MNYKVTAGIKVQGVASFFCARCETKVGINKAKNNYRMQLENNYSEKIEDSYMLIKFYCTRCLNDCGCPKKLKENPNNKQ